MDFRKLLQSPEYDFLHTDPHLAGRIMLLGVSGSHGYGTSRPGEALSVTRAYGTKTGIRMRNIFRKITALPGVPTLMWKNMDKIAAKMSSGYECENLIVTDHLCSLDVKSCPLFDKAKELGTPEAVQMICCMDKEYMTGFRGIDYTRTRSVAEGDDCCDYRLRDSRSRKKR